MGKDNPKKLQADILKNLRKDPPSEDTIFAQICAVAHRNRNSCRQLDKKEKALKILNYEQIQAHSLKFDSSF